jgi:hypothetical protein
MKLLLTMLCSISLLGCSEKLVRQQKVPLCEQPLRESNEVRDYIRWGYDQAEALANCNIEIQKANSERGN